MNKVHPDKPSKLYKNKTASLHSSGRGSSCEERVAPDSNEEFTVLSNSLSGLGGFKSGIKSQGGGVEEAAVKDQFELEEERLQELKEDSDNEELVRHVSRSNHVLVCKSQFLFQCACTLTSGPTFRIPDSLLFRYTLLIDKIWPRAI